MIPDPLPQIPHVEPIRDFISRSVPLPKLVFPTFDGDNPRLWRDRCDMFFEVYSVGDQLKTRFTALNFKGVAASWHQTAERRGLDWDKFCQNVFDRFDWDQYHLQLRQLDTLRQTGSVSEYLEKFEQLSHGILLYNPSYDDTYFVVRFLGGLKDDIRTAITLHQPKDVQSASTLALLQEEEIANGRKQGLSRVDHKDSGKHTSKPGYSDKSKAPSPKDDSARDGKSDEDDKLSALMAHRRIVLQMW